MKRIGLALILSFTFCVGVKAQKPSEYFFVDQVMTLVPESQTRTSQGLADFVNSKFFTPREKARAIFIWITANIRYDVDNMYRVVSYKDVNELVNSALANRKGVCANYAELFNKLAGLVGIKSYVINGYTRQNGVVDAIPHSWCAGKIDSTWVFFDPTWGAGYVRDKRFVKKLNTSYFMISPEQMIKSHMPFDPLWQFLNTPVSGSEFCEKKTETKSIGYFNFVDSLALYEQQTVYNRLVSSNRRIEKNGIMNKMVFDKIAQNKDEIEYIDANRTVDKYNLTVNAYNEGVRKLNRFVGYRNNQFTPILPDYEIRLMLDSASYSLEFSRSNMAEIKNPEKSIESAMAQMSKLLDDVFSHLKEQKIFLDKYLKTGKGSRKYLFVKYTWNKESEN